MKFPEQRWLGPSRPGGGGVMGFDCRHEGTFGGDGNVLTLDCGGGCILYKFPKHHLHWLLTMAEFYGMYAIPH